MRKLTVILFCLSRMASVPTEGATVQVEQVVAPNNRATVEGNSGTSSPFLPYNSVLTGEYDPRRFQQVYDAAEFAALIPNGGWISRMSFRGSIQPDGRWGSVQANLRDIQVNFSTTPKAVDQLSVTYSENIGMDDTIVFGRGPLANLFLIDTPGLFTGHISFTDPFFYDPRVGNLLLDVRTYAGIPLPPFPPDAIMDAENTIDDSVSSLSGSLARNDGTRSSLGLVTRFEITPVPEPSSVGLMVLCVLALSYPFWRHKRDRDFRIGP